MTTSVNADLANPLADVASALFVLWGGHNDILVDGQSQGPLNVVNMVRSLQAAGAQDILVPGMMDLGLTPFGNCPSVSQRCSAILQPTTRSYNNSCPQASSISILL